MEHYTFTLLLLVFAESRRQMQSYRQVSPDQSSILRIGPRVGFLWVRTAGKQLWKKSEQTAQDRTLRIRSTNCSIIVKDLLFLVQTDL